MKSSPFQRPVLLIALLILIAVLCVKPGGDSWTSKKTSKTVTVPDAGNFTDLPKATASLPSVSNTGEREISSSPTANAKVVLSEKTAAAMSRETSDLEVITHSDGRRSVDLKGRFSHMSASVTTPDGRSVVQCFSDAEALAAALSQNPTTK